VDDVDEKHVFKIVNSDEDFVYNHWVQIIDMYEQELLKQINTTQEVSNLEFHIHGLDFYDGVEFADDGTGVTVEGGYLPVCNGDRVSIEHKTTIVELGHKCNRFKYYIWVKDARSLLIDHIVNDTSNSMTREGFIPLAALCAPKSTTFNTSGTFRR